MLQCRWWCHELQPLSLPVKCRIAGCGSTISNTNNDSNIVNDTGTDTVDNYETNDELLDTSEGVELLPNEIDDSSISINALIA